MRTHLYVLLLSSGLAAIPAAGENTAHLVANYRIAASYDAQEKSLTGREVLRWVNESPDTIPELRFHLYMNAFKNERSTFNRESGGALRGDRIERDKNPWGSIDITKMALADTDLTKDIRFIHPDDNNADDQTVIAVPLAKPVKPGEAIELAIEFKTKFPKVFARTGYAGTFLLAGQWFPKIGVWEKAGDRYATVGGWNCHQFHANSEFYADYGTYDVDLTVPANEVIGATGELVKRVEDAAKKTVTYSYHQSNVHDFAWTVQPDYVKLERVFEAAKQVTKAEIDAVQKRHGIAREDAALTDVKVTVLLQPEHANQAERHFAAAFNAIKYFGLWYGHYPHKTLTVVDPPRNGAGAGGMEYPTFITAGTSYQTSPGDGTPEGVVVHEFGHQFWQGQVGSNEFEEAWMDEGFNTYSTGKVMDLVYGRVQLPLSFGGLLASWFTSLPSYNTLEENRAAYLGIGPKADSMFRYAWQYQNQASYGLNSYMRPGLMLMTLERLLGEDVMERVMRVYQQRYRYRHPGAPDFIRTVNEVTDKDWKWYFDQTLYSSNVIDYKVDSVENIQVKTDQGLFDRDGKRVVVLPVDATKADEAASKKNKDTKQEPQYRNKITIRREGEAILPVTVRIQWENGEEANETWDGQYRWVKYEYTKRSKVKAVDVDPKRQIVLDVNFTNNSWRSEPEKGPLSKWSSTLLFWIQNVMQLASMVN